MKTKLRGRLAALLATLAVLAATLFTWPMAALAQGAQTPLGLNDNGGHPVTECAYTLAGNIVPCHVIKVWNGTAWIDLVVDASTGALVMKTNNGALDTTLQAQQANPGSDSAKAAGVQGCTGCKAVAVSGSVAASNFPSSVSTGAGPTGANSPRSTVAQDGSTVAGSAPGTAGSPSANVVTVQGAPGMTALASKQQDSGGGDATDTVNHAVKVNCVTGCSGGSGFGGKPGSSSYLTSGPIVFTGTAPVTALAAGGAGLFDYVTDVDCSNSGLSAVTISVLNSASQTLWSMPLQSGGGLGKAFGAWIGGNGHAAVNTAISIQATGPAFAGTNVGSATISSGTYTSATGVVSLTLSANSPFLAPEALVISGLTGTGGFASLDGTFTATNVSGTTVTFQGPTGLGATTITGGSLAYSPSIVCNVQGYSWGS